MRILILCEEIVNAGGLFRFQRFGRILIALGHQVEFAVMQHKAGQERFGIVPVISLEQAKNRSWDCTMVPGAGFSDNFIAELKLMNHRKWGLKVQHILNDQTKHDRFKNVNTAFLPDLIIINNEHWLLEELIQFTAQDIRYLVGGVEHQTLSALPIKSANMKSEVVLAGLVNKTPDTLIDILKKLPKNFRLQLMGDERKLQKKIPSGWDKSRVDIYKVNSPEDLKKFMQKANIVFSLEYFAGWANIAAEAMSANVPVICTKAGTISFAIDQKTAWVLPFDYTTQDIINSIHEVLNKDNATVLINANKHIAHYDWENYSRRMHRLLSLCIRKKPITWAGMKLREALVSIGN